LNLGSGPLQVAPGWIGVDASAHLLVRWLPEALLRRVLRHTDVGEQAAATVKRGRFVFWNLSNGIPYNDSSAEAVFSSHMLEHLTDTDAVTLLGEMRRVLVPGGIARIVVPEVHAGDDDEYERSGRAWHSHRSRWTWPKLRGALELAGFTEVERTDFREGRCPDLDLLDNRPGSLFVEATRS
jgi:predicted SAM-dependent methyltransferase